MDIKEIKKRFELLKKIDGGTFVQASDLAKELKVSKTDLMMFIEDNPKLFDAEYKYSPKNVLLGLCINTVYTSPEENVYCEEGIERMRMEYAKYIYIREFNNYGRIEGYYIEIDEPRERNNNVHLWRNTKEKLDELKKMFVVQRGVFYQGGWGDCSKCPKDYVITEKGLATLEANGWTFNKLKPVG